MRERSKHYPEIIECNSAVTDGNRLAKTVEEAMGIAGLAMQIHKTAVDEIAALPVLDKANILLQAKADKTSCYGELFRAASDLMISRNATTTENVKKAVETFRASDEAIRLAAIQLLDAVMKSLPETSIPYTLAELALAKLESGKRVGGVQRDLPASSRHGPH